MTEIICQKKFTAIGGEFQFSTFPQNFLTKEAVLEIFEAGIAEVRRIEEKYTDFKSSYFNRINEQAGISAVEVDEETLALVKRAIDISTKSEGTFDISYASIGFLWRSSKENNSVLTEAVINEHLKYVDFNLIDLDEIKKTIYLPHKKMKIGLGGIGKGYAVDAVYDLFIKRGLYNFYINGAGDIRVHSRTDAPRKWRIGIRNPLSIDASKAVGVVQLSNGAIASSGGYIHNVNGDKTNHHILNPQTGKSSQDIIASTVIAENAIIADTTATILMNMNPVSCINFLDKNDLAGIVFSSEGKSYLSKKAVVNFGMH